MDREITLYFHNPIQIAVFSNHCLIPMVNVMNADGTNPINPSNNTSNADTEPDWSPDGTKIAFTTGKT